MSQTYLLKFLYYLSRFSGFLFIDINFDTFGKVTTRKSFWNVVVFAVSFGYSAIATSYDDDIAIAEVMHSKMMEIGINFVIKFMLFVTCFVKFGSIFCSRKFLDVMTNFQWNFLEVDKQS